MFRKLDYVMTGVSTLIGREITMNEWAQQIRVPNRKIPGAFLTGEEVRKITGIDGKAWEPELFRDPGVIVRLAEDALRAAQTRPDQIDAVLVVTATPYQVQLDMDSFRLLRELRIRDDVAPMQLGAGCCGMARAMTLASRLDAQNVLVITYELSSMYMESEIYRSNPDHPMSQVLWLSPAVFSDGAAAIVLRKDERARGFVTYSRDALAFGDAPGFDDPLIHYLGGGAAHPPGVPGSEQLACYAMAGDKTKAYYAKGMMLNHEALRAQRARYWEDVARIYVHQSNPRLVDGLIDYLSGEAGVPREKFVSHARRLGNLVTPSTVKLLDDDIQSGAVRSGDEICVSVVGSGPERGAYLISLA
jgi:3-oxoacyl-[acyl-carrier-protein] synthase III